MLRRGAVSGSSYVSVPCQFRLSSVLCLVFASPNRLPVCAVPSSKLVFVLRPTVPLPEPRSDMGPLPPPRPPLAGSASAPMAAVSPPAPARLKPRTSAQSPDNNNHAPFPAPRRTEHLAVPLSERLAAVSSSTAGFSEFSFYLASNGLNHCLGCGSHIVPLEFVDGLSLL